MLTLRYYQEEAVTGLFKYFETNYGNPIVALPTGTGKAFVIAEFLRRALHLYPQTRALVITHVKELIAQNHAELLEIWPTAPAGIFSAGLKRKEAHFPITFCGIASIRKALSYFGRVDLVLVDEAHLISNNGEAMYSKVIAELKAINPFLKVIGFTATPYRLGMGMLTKGKIFTDITTNYCTMEKFNELVDSGFISPLIPKMTETELDVTGVGITKGEYNTDELQAAVDKESITRAALEEAVRLGAGRRHWLVFTTGTRHADHARDILISLGIPAVSVHSNLLGGDEERDKNIRLFKGGYVGAMVGVGVFTTGFNFKPVDFIIVLRPTLSPVLWVQLLGRGTRPSPETGKQNCLVLDFAANTRKLGPINDPVIPSRKKKKGGDWIPYKICPACNTYNHARARFCCNCQQEFPERFAASKHAATDELIRREKKEEAPKQEATVAEFVVQRVEYAKHFSKDLSKPPSLRVTYYCESRTFNEWLCLEHPRGFALHKAHENWRLMAGGYDGDIPDTVDGALGMVNDLQPPTKIRVLFAGKWPEVVGYEFGTPGCALPMAYAVDDGADDFSSGVNSHGKTVQQAVEDGDIPF
jgi:DNA repair protein RadD